MEFQGAGRRFELVGNRGDVAVYDDYAHHPAEVSAAIAAARERQSGRVLVLFQPHLYSRTRHLAHEFGAALAAADAVAITEIYRAREEPQEGVSGKLIVDSLAERRPGMPIAWAPELEDGARLLAHWARGAGDVDRAGPLVLEALR